MGGRQEWSSEDQRDIVILGSLMMRKFVIIRVAEFDMNLSFLTDNILVAFKLNELLLKLEYEHVYKYYTCDQVDSKNLLDRVSSSNIGSSNTNVLDSPCLLVLITKNVSKQTTHSSLTLFELLSYAISASAFFELPLTNSVLFQSFFVYLSDLCCMVVVKKTVGVVACFLQEITSPLALGLVLAAVEGLALFNSASA
ncbi:hypothetical protein Tco_0007811 [Tanacetum coccineum]